MAALWHLEVPCSVVELEPPLVAHSNTLATLDSSCICSLHHHLWQCQILNSLNKSRDLTHILTQMTLGPELAKLQHELLGIFFILKIRF